MNYFGWLRNYEVRGEIVRLSFSMDRSRGEIETKPIDISPEGLEIVGEPSMNLCLKEARIISIELERPEHYMAHFLKPRNRLWKLMMGNVVKNMPSYTAIDMGPYSFVTGARWNIPGYDLIATWAKNADGLKVGHPLFPEHPFTDNKQLLERNLMRVNQIR